MKALSVFMLAMAITTLALPSYANRGGITVLEGINVISTAIGQSSPEANAIRNYLRSLGINFSQDGKPLTHAKVMEQVKSKMESDEAFKAQAMAILKKDANGTVTVNSPSASPIADLSPEQQAAATQQARASESSDGAAAIMAGQQNAAETSVPPWVQELYRSMQNRVIRHFGESDPHQLEEALDNTAKLIRLDRTASRLVGHDTTWGEGVQNCTTGKDGRGGMPWAAVVGLQKNLEALAEGIIESTQAGLERIRDGYVKAINMYAAEHGMPRSKACENMTVLANNCNVHAFALNGSVTTLKPNVVIPCGAL